MIATPVASALLCGALFARPAFGQSHPAAPLTFEAASIRPDTPARSVRLEGGPGTSDPGRIDYGNLSLRHFIMAAFRVGDYQIAAPSAPDAKALDAKSFEIVAKLPPGATQSQLRVMLQTLLIERFHLAFHWESKMMPAYTLTVAKNGPKLKEVASQSGADADSEFDTLPPPPPNELETDHEGYPVVPPKEGSWLVALRSGPARTHQLSMSMRELAALLSVQLEKPVTDATGLKGRYEFTLTWMAGIPALSAEGPVGPGLQSALRRQLGLKLEASKGPVETLVIDHLEKDPTAN